MKLLFQLRIMFSDMFYIGLLIAKKSVFRNPVPGGCGGGTVLFVSYQFTIDRKD